jgi:hypothetical protein
VEGLMGLGTIYQNIPCVGKMRLFTLQGKLTENLPLIHFGEGRMPIVETRKQSEGIK